MKSRKGILWIYAMVFWLMSFTFVLYMIFRVLTLDTPELLLTLFMITMALITALLSFISENIESPSKDGEIKTKKARGSKVRIKKKQRQVGEMNEGCSEKKTQE